jgi:hypothetical protein
MEKEQINFSGLRLQLRPDVRARQLSVSVTQTQQIH